LEIKRLPPKERTTMPVSELRTLFGIKKVESYWIIHNKPIETITVGGKLRIVISSFEEWYNIQFHYKKVNGPPPGSAWTATTLSVKEVTQILGNCEQTVYDMLKKGKFDSIKVDNRTRILKESFHNWYLNQKQYKIREEYIGGFDNGINSQEKE